MKGLILLKYRDVVPKCFKTGKHRYLRFWISAKKISRKRKKGYKKVYICTHCGKIKDNGGFVFFNRVILSIFKETMYFLEGGNIWKIIKAKKRTK